MRTLAQVLEEHPLPFALRHSTSSEWLDQYEAIEDLIHYPRAGLYAEVGTGKTVMATCLALCWDAPVILCTMPPILFRQWKKWLESIGGIGDVLVYRGSVKERKALQLKPRPGVRKWVLMTTGILKNDFTRIKAELGPIAKTVLVDEATAIKNADSGNHKAVAEIAEGQNLALLTGTPLSTPHDAYGYIKLISPIVYRSKAQFDNIHVDTLDIFKKVTGWKNIELMKSNLMLNSIRLLKEQVLSGLDKPNYIPITYDLSPEHYELYKELAEEQILELENGGKIDATSASKLYNALQQIVVNWDYFSGVEDARSTAYDLVDRVMDDIDVMHPASSKLIIASYYKITSRALLCYLQEFGAVGIYGEISAKQQEINSDRFENDPKCRIAVIQPQSGGYGSNYQHVCSEVLFIESPRAPIHFNQVVGRVYRDGQKNVPNIHIGIASGTIQKRLFENMLTNDELLTQIQGGFKALREAVYGR